MKEEYETFLDWEYAFPARHGACSFPQRNLGCVGCITVRRAKRPQRIERRELFTPLVSHCALRFRLCSTVIAVGGGIFKKRTVQRVSSWGVHYYINITV